MNTTAERSPNWMWEIMQEATEELQKWPAWKIEMLQNAPRMYPSMRPKEDPPAPLVSEPVPLDP